MIDERQRVFVEGVQTFTDGFDVVIGTSGRQSTAHEPLGHGFVADLKVDDEGTGFDVLFKLDALSHLSGVSIDQVALGGLQLGEHSFLQQV